MKRKAIAGAQVAVTGVLFWLLFRDFDRSAFTAAFRQLPVWLYATSLAVVLFGQGLYTWRWRVMLSAVGVRISFARAFELFSIGTFASNFLPSTVGGDVAKVYYLGREHGYGAITASVVLDRMLGVAILAVLTSVLLWLSPPDVPFLATVRILLLILGVVTFAVLGVIVRGSGGLSRRLDAFGPRAAAVAERLRRFRLNLAAGVIRPRVPLASLAVILLYFGLITPLYGQFIRLQTGLQPGFLAILTAIATTAVLSNVPVSLNGLGLREQLHVALLAPLGVPREVAVAISLIFFANVLAVSLIGGIFWMRFPTTPRGVVAPTAS